MEPISDAYDGNGDFTNYNEGSSNFKRNTSIPKAIENDEVEDGAAMEKTNEYIAELLAEKTNLDHKFPNADRLIDFEIQKAKESGKIPPREHKYVDIYREKQIRVMLKVLVPVKEHPKFNFVGKLLGPKGNSLKRLQEETMCKMAVLGHGSMKDRKKEEELRASLDPKYAHLHDELHVEISALAPPAEAHARIAYALAEVRKYLIPDSNDMIRQEQLREMLSDPNSVAVAESAPPPKRVAVHTVPRTHHRHPISTTHSPIPTISTTSRTVMPVKQKILSILDRARTSMTESYTAPVSARYEEQEAHYEPTAYEYSYAHAVAPVARSRYAEVPDEYEEYRRDYYREPTTYAVPTTSSKLGRSSWKPSLTYPATSLHEEASVAKHSHYHGTRDTRYRSSPYSRPQK